jgi:alkyldihydroxyacetonephosphate synthase
MAREPFNHPQPHSDDEVADHKWGYSDTKFVVNADRTVSMTGHRYSLSGYKMPNFIPYVEEMLGLKLDLDDIKSEVADKTAPEPNRNEPFCSAVAAAFADDQYTFDTRDRLIHSHGQTSADEVYKILYGQLPRVVDMVFYCRSESDAQDIVNLALEYNVCLVPYGGGTSVSNALLLPKSETRMIVSVDMRPMNRILWIDRENYQASVEAGITGQQLGDLLTAEGFTMGHDPGRVDINERQRYEEKPLRQYRRDHR